MGKKCTKINLQKSEFKKQEKECSLMEVQPLLWEEEKSYLTNEILVPEMDSNGQKKEMASLVISIYHFQDKENTSSHSPYMIMRET